MEGSSKIGSATNSDIYVDNMRGIYTNHGFIGATDINVFSANGRDVKYDVGDIYDFPDLYEEPYDPDNPPTTDFDYTTGAYPFPTVPKQWQDKLRDNSLVLSAGLLTSLPGSVDDRVMLPHLKSDTDSSNDTTFTPAGGWATGKTYLSKSCTDMSLFGFGVGLSPTGIVTSITGMNFSLNAGTTTAFSCRKYRVTFPNTTPNKATDEVVTAVIWSGPGGSMGTSSGNKTFGLNELYVGGKGGGVMFWGKDLNISGGNNTKVGHYGTGVLFAEDSNREEPNTGLTTGGNINVTVDFVPAKSTNDNWALASNKVTGRLDTLQPNPATKNTYPATAVVGLIARQNVSNGGAQRQLSTAIYAKQEVSGTQQTVVAGSIVTKCFDAGSQVPTVLFVPTLPQKLPKLMPGTNGTTLSVSNTAWNCR